MQDLIMSMTLHSPYWSWDPHSWTSLMNSSMSMVSGSKVKLFQALWRCVRDRPWVEKYWEKQSVSSSHVRVCFSLSQRSANYSLALPSSVCLKFLSMSLSVTIPIASNQSSALRRWASGLSPGSPLNVGGLILLIALLIFFLFRAKNFGPLAFG